MSTTAAAAAAAAEAAQAEFARAARSGSNAMAEYASWQVARDDAMREGMGARHAVQRAYQERLAEYHQLVIEARRLVAVEPYAGGTVGLGATTGPRAYPREEHDAACAAWCERASAYAGRPVQAVSAAAVEIPAQLRGADLPPVPSIPAVPPYDVALRQAAAAGG